jgi:methionyl-tRNA synthetase
MCPTPSPTVKTARDLLRRNADLATWLADLGTRSADAARALAQPGTPPPGDYLEEMAEAVREFGSLRDEVLAMAGRTSIAVPAASEVVSTRELHALLRALIEKIERETQAAAAARARQDALALLDRVAALTHRDDPHFAALTACQSQARDLHSTIAGAADSERTIWTPALAPFAALLTLLDGQQALTDEAWSVLEDSVAETFGRPLAVAAARRKLGPR